MKAIDISELDLSRYIQPGSGIVVGQGTGEPQTLTEVLVRQAGRLSTPTVFLGGGTFSRTFTPSTSAGLRFLGYGGAGAHRALIKAGLMDVIPAHVAQVPVWFGQQIRCDVALVQISPPREDGSHSYSLIGDYTPQAVQRASVVLAELNHHAPRTHGDQVLRPEQITVLVETDRPLLQLPAVGAGELERRIAAHVLGFIADRSTLQIGPGAIPEAILAALADHKDLGLHSGVIGDAAVALIERGVLTNAFKEVDAGTSVTGALWGTDRLYRFAHDNPAIRLCSLAHTHAPAVLGRLKTLVSVNSALEVDLTGQVNAEQVGAEYLGAVGGQVDFVRAAARAERGASLIVLPSTAGEGRISKIVARLNGPVTTARCEVDVIATEHGAVRLKGMPLRERVRRMLALAAEPFRESLARQAFELYGVR